MRYPDEFHVLNAAGGILHAGYQFYLIFPCSFWGGAPPWSMVVPDNRMCRRIFRALHIARFWHKRVLVLAVRFAGY